MARVRSVDFLPRLQTAALRVFARQGLKHARMSDIAKEMGVAHGSLYNYFESKEALFYWLVDLGLEAPDVRGAESFPIQTRPVDLLARRLRKQMGHTFALPALDRALRRHSDDARTEFAAILVELYERTLATRFHAAAMERSAVEIPELFNVFFVEFRRSLLDRLSRYIQSRVKTDQFVQVPDPVVAARYVVETITLFARHRFSDPDLPPGDEQSVHRTVVELLVRSFVPETAGSRRRKRGDRR
jgi:AcrR family transcriptional regulator